MSEKLDREEYERVWELEHRLWDFLQWIEGQYTLAIWHNEGRCKECGIRHLVDQLRPLTGGFSERRNLPRRFLKLESWEESEKKADELLAELRRKSEAEKK